MKFCEVLSLLLKHQRTDYLALLRDGEAEGAFRAIFTRAYNASQR